MFIIAEYRSPKIGAHVLEEVVTITKRKGWKRIDETAPTEEKWLATVLFYEKNGFSFTGPKLKKVL